MLTEPKEWREVISVGKILFLAVVVYSIFLIAEHNSRMSTIKNFVMDIEQQESWAAGGNTLRRLAFLGCAGLGVLGLMFGKWNEFRWNKPMVLLVMYLLWTGVSIMWSIDTGATSRRYIVMMCCVVGCIGFARFYSMEQVLIASIITFSAWLLFGLAAEIIFGGFRPHVGDYRFAGSLHPNLQSANLAVLCLASFTMSRIRPKFKLLFYGIIIVAFGFMLLTKCRTVVAVLPVSLLAIWLATERVDKITIGTVAAVWGFSILVLGFVVIGFDPVNEYSELLLLGRGEETGSSLTGRLPLWSDLSRYIVDRPLQGYGFGAFWTPSHIYQIAIGQEWVISEAHSSYVDAALQTGLIGASLMIAIAISTFFHVVTIYRRTRQPEYMFIIGGVVFCLIRALTESGLSGPLGYTAPLFLAMAAHSWNSLGPSKQPMNAKAAEPSNPQLVSPE